jgi:hypothetical protein
MHRERGSPAATLVDQVTDREIAERVVETFADDFLGSRQRIGPRMCCRTTDQDVAILHLDLDALAVAKSRSRGNV